MKMPSLGTDHEYSIKYFDDFFEYRHILLSAEAYKLYQEMKKARNDNYLLLTERESQNLGVLQSKGWNHYMVFEPEPWVLLYRR